MSINITLDESTVATLRAVLAAVDGTAPAVETRTQPATLVAAKAHCYEARMVRREKTALGGLTKAERSSLYHAHPELSTMTKTARAKAWAQIVAAYKAA